MFFRMPDTHRLAWGNPKANQLPEAVMRLRTASHPVTVTLHAITCFTLLLFIAAGVGLREDMSLKVFGGFILAITILSGLSMYLSRGTKRAKETVLAAHDDHRQVILVDSDGYRLLNDALFRRSRLRLGTLLNRPQYHQAMLCYIRDIEVPVAQLSVADGRQAERAAHKQLVDIAEATAVAIAQIYAAENAIEV
jgi:hypothetical protein